MWSVPPPSAGASLCDWARANELACYSRRVSWSQIGGFDLPAVLELTATRKASVHILLFGLSEDEARVLVNGQVQRITRSDLERVWRGKQIFLWRPPLASPRPIVRGQRGERVRWLYETLAYIDGGDVPSRDNPAFNGALMKRVKEFQYRSGLVADGIVGVQTFIHLNKMALSARTPSLARATDADGRALDETSLAMEAR